MGLETTGLPYATIREGIEFESIVDNLLRKQQYRVEIWAGKTGKINGWEIIKKVCKVVLAQIACHALA
jgi:hypothetical protein